MVRVRVLWVGDDLGFDDMNFALPLKAGDEFVVKVEGEGNVLCLVKWVVQCPVSPDCEEPPSLLVSAERRPATKLWKRRWFWKDMAQSMIGAK